MTTATTNEVIVEIKLKPNDVYTPLQWSRVNIARWVSAAVLCYGFYDLYTHSTEALRFFDGGQSILAILVLLFVFILLGLLLFPYLRVLALFRKSAMRRPRLVTFSPTGITIESEDANVDCKWSIVKRVMETRSLFLLLYTTAGAMYLPKRCFASHEDIVRLRQIISENFKGRWQLRRD
jgi:hypothetical protein